MGERMKCPKCDCNVRQYKIGRTEAGSQRYRCSLCNCRYTPVKKARGYKPEIRQKAICLYVTGYRPRQIGDRLQVHHTTVSKWIKTYLRDQPHESYPGLDMCLE
jgi:transposase-like protein